MAAEVEYLGKALHDPARPFVAILGGAKVSDKLEVIENLLGKVDALLIGGAMAYTFLKARGLPVGKSLVEADLVDTARDLEKRAKARGVRLELPVDHIVAPKLEAGAPTQILEVTNEDIGDRMGSDIGPKTAANYRDVIATAKTVVRNGPMGVLRSTPLPPAPSRSRKPSPRCRARPSSAAAIRWRREPRRCRRQDDGFRPAAARHGVPRGPRIARCRGLA